MATHKIVLTSELTRGSAYVGPGNITAGNIFIDTATKFIHVAEDGVDFGPEGVTVQCVYSYLNNEWNSDALLNKEDFPMISITEEKFELQNGWNFGDQTTIDLMRDGGWAVKDGATSLEEYANITTLGNFQDAGVDQAYYTQVLAGSTTDIVLTGPVNQAVKIYGDASNGDFDYRSYFKIFLREEGKTYDEYDLLAAQSLAALTYQKYAMPLSNSLDIKYTKTDVQVQALITDNSVTLEWLAVAQDVDFGTGDKQFTIALDGKGLVSEDIYMIEQFLLRSTSSINDAATGDQIGEVVESLMEFVGDKLYTKTISSGGVIINNFHADDTNTIIYSDDNGDEWEFEFVSTGTVTVSQTLVDDIEGKVWMYLKASPTANFPGSTAVLVEDSVGSPIAYEVAGLTKGFTMAYDTNDQGGRTPATDMTVVLVANGKDKAQYVKLEGTIFRTAGNNFTLTAPLERNYSA